MRVGRSVGWGVLLTATTAFSLWSIASRSFPQGHLETALAVVFFSAQPLGALWMALQVVRRERRKWPYLLAAFVPYSFLWYYFDRYAQLGPQHQPPTEREGAHGVPRNPAVGLLYLVTAVLGLLASAAETSLGLAASYVLLAAAVLTFGSSRRLSLWLAVVASASLAAYFVPSEVRNLVVYPHVVLARPISGAISLALLGSVILSLVVSVKRMRGPSGRAGGASETNL